MAELEEKVGFMKEGEERKRSLGLNWERVMQKKFRSSERKLEFDAEFRLLY